MHDVSMEKSPSMHGFSSEEIDNRLTFDMRIFLLSPGNISKLGYAFMALSKSTFEGRKKIR